MKHRVVRDGFCLKICEVSDDGKCSPVEISGPNLVTLQNQIGSMVRALDLPILDGFKE